MSLKKQRKVFRQEAKAMLKLKAVNNIERYKRITDNIIKALFALCVFELVMIIIIIVGEWK
jgi:lipopolysaccharide/colanic/teichoic acid biosynthesis glycosyltransferase